MFGDLVLKYGVFLEDLDFLSQRSLFVVLGSLGELVHPDSDPVLYFGHVSLEFQGGHHVVQVDLAALGQV